MIDKKSIGKTVYTVRKTGKIDEWTCAGFLPTKKELLIHLINDKKYCFLPARCVFATEAEAREVAKK